jgi:hypothetical protein
VGPEEGTVLAQASFDGGPLAATDTAGLPVPKDKWSGVMGVCALERGSYVLYYDYASTNSAVSVYSR